MDDERGADDDSVRARRARRSRLGPGGRAGAFAQRNLKAYALVAGIALAAMGVYALVEYLPKPAKPEGEKKIHIHAGYKILIGADEVDMHKCEFDLNGCGGVDGTHYLAGHLHYNEALRYMLHIEHPVAVGDLTLGRYLEKGPKFHVTNTSLTLDTRVYDGRTIANNATHTWQLWVQYCVKQPAVWERLMDIPGYIPQQHDRFVLVYTDQTLAQLEPKLETTPTSEQMREARGGACPIVKGIYSSVGPSTSG